MANPHDAIFKLAFSAPERAARLIARLLPPELSARLVLDQATVAPSSFIEESLQDRFADLVVSVPVREPADDEADMAWVYVLLEHQSTVDPLMAFRLLRYMVRIWEGWLDERPTARRLPAILPLVVAQATGRWTAARAFEDLIATAPPLRPLLAPSTPSFRYLLTELRTTPDAALGCDDVALVLKAMKHARANDFLARFEAVAADLRLLLGDDRSLRLLAALVHYLLEVRPAEESDAFVALVRRAAGPEAGDTAMTAADHLREEGRKQGRQEGSKSAEIRALVRLLTRRFGSLDSSTLQVLEGSSADERELWFDRVLTAATLSDVFTR